MKTRWVLIRCRTWLDKGNDQTTIYTKLPFLITLPAPHVFFLPKLAKPLSFSVFDSFFKHPIMQSRTAFPHSPRQQSDLMIHYGGCHTCMLDWWFFWDSPVRGWTGLLRSVLLSLLMCPYAPWVAAVCALLPTLPPTRVFLCFFAGVQMI